MQSIEHLGLGIYAIDSGYGRPLLDAVHLIVENNRAAIVDTGTVHSVPMILRALAQANVANEAVDYILLTHVHLDHAGGAGALMQVFPNARLIVHSRGARHMVDPSKLWQGTVAVYGEDNSQRLYGQLVGADEARVVIAEDELEINLAQSRRILVRETPGHAKHHVCYWDERSRGWFTGDTFGLSYRELDRSGRQFIFPTTTPVHFDPQALHNSIELLMQFDPQCMYLTHYSKITDIKRLALDLHRLIDAHVTIARAHAADAIEKRHEALLADLAQLVKEEALRSGWALQDQDAVAIYAGDLELNAQGLEVWLDTNP